MSNKAKEWNGLPECLKRYMDSFAGDENAEYPGCRLIGKKMFFAENFDSSPGIYIREYGYWTIGRTDTGDALCIDKKSGKLLLFSVGRFYGKPGKGMVVGLRGEDGYFKSDKKCDEQTILDCISNEFEGISDFLRWATQE